MFSFFGLYVHELSVSIVVMVRLFCMVISKDESLVNQKLPI